MNIVETVFLISLALTSAVLMLSAVTKSKVGSKYKENSNKKTLVGNTPVAYAETHASVETKSNVVSIVKYRARKEAQKSMLVSKVNNKETRIVYPLKKLKP